MIRLIAAAALLAGCAPSPDGPATGEKRAGNCACERRICACPHCKGGAEKCPCKETERPK